MKYWEDFEVGSETIHGEHEITADEIVRFAKEFDPQPFHIDPDIDGPFGGLIASGWQTTARTMRLLVEHFVSPETSLGAAGVDEIAWSMRFTVTWLRSGSWIQSRVPSPTNTCGCGFSYVQRNLPGRAKAVPA